MKKIFFLLILLASCPAVSFATQADEDYNTGLQFYQQGQIDKAIQYCQSAVQADPNHWQSYQILGYCYYTEKNNTLALQNLDRSLQLNPNNPALQKFDDQVRAATPNAPPVGSAAAPSTQAGTTPVAMLPVNTAAIAADKRNHNLPKEGSFNFEGTLDYVYTGYQDLNNFYGGIYVTDIVQAVELDFGGAFAFTPNIQADLLFEFGGKTPIDVTDGSDVDEWTEYYIGGAAGLNILAPISDGLNFIIHGEGGYYTLVGSKRTITGFNDGYADMNASDPGFAVSAGLEFLMDSNKSWAMNIQLGYRYLQFTPVTGSGVYNGSPDSGTFTNADSSNMTVDFSGPRLSYGIRF
jgi:hypothetical protein